MLVASQCAPDYITLPLQAHMVHVMTQHGTKVVAPFYLYCQTIGNPGEVYPRRTLSYPSFSSWVRFLSEAFQNS